MTTTEIISIDGHEAVKLPDEYRIGESTISIRKQGSAIILEPIRPDQWPAGFFEEIRIDDPAFKRPCQGEAPPAPSIDSP